MRNFIILLMSISIISASCTKQAYEGAIVGGAAGSAVGAILDEENPWRGAFIGGVVGAVVTGTVVEIASKAANECAEYGKPVEYKCYKCRERIRIRAVPGRWVGKCRIVKVYYYKDGKVIKIKRKRVCNRKRHF